jgi:heme-degrading monooxygenase HmoA
MFVQVASGSRAVLRSDAMYIAMNRFKVSTPRAGEFEEVWRARDRHLSEVSGFVSFKLLRGVDEDGVTIMASHTTWASQDAFRAWTESEAFRKAHSGARTPDGVILGPPKFEGYEVVLEE